MLPATSDTNVLRLTMALLPASCLSYRHPRPRWNTGSTGGVESCAGGVSGRSATVDLRDILVCVDATAAGEGRLRIAAAIAREHGAHLSAAYVLQGPMESAALRLPTVSNGGSVM